MRDKIFPRRRRRLGFDYLYETPERKRYKKVMRKAFLAVTLLIAPVGALGTMQKGLIMYSAMEVNKACRKLDENTLRQILKRTTFSSEYGYITLKPELSPQFIPPSFDDLQKTWRIWQDKTRVLEMCKKAIKQKSK